MNLELVHKLSAKPSLYQKGSSMWTDPYISKQLLELHLNSDHDIASRNKDKIEQITNWILEKSDKQNMEILDLGCGPGLYSEMFAKKGHIVTGIDFSENSIEYAIKQALEKKLNIRYIQMNYLNLDFEKQFDIVILIYLDFCVLLPDERDRLLEKIYRSLKPGGLFIFDVVNGKNLNKKILSQSWEIQKSGFWRNTSYIALSNGHHYPEAKVLLNQHIIIEESKVDSYFFWNHYYEKSDLIPILKGKGFSKIKNYENVLPASNDVWNGENVTFYISTK